MAFFVGSHIVLSPNFSTASFTPSVLPYQQSWNTTTARLDRFGQMTAISCKTSKSSWNPSQKKKSMSFTSHVSPRF